MNALASDAEGLTSKDREHALHEIFAGTVDFEFASTSRHGSTYHQECQRLVTKIRKELYGAQQIVKRSNTKTTHLFELMCSADSEMSKQCQNMGNNSRRFGLAQTLALP